MRSEGKPVRCVRCIMPADYPTVVLDEQSVCSFCHRWDRLWSAPGTSGARPELRDVIESVKNPRAPYDCVTGLSGGKDSCYAAYLCHQSGLRQVAVTFNNGFLSEEAERNIKNVVDRWSLAHVRMGPGWKTMRALYRECLLRTGEFCSVCNIGIRATLYRTARFFRVRSIIAGTSPRTEANSPDEFFSTSSSYFENVFRSSLSKRQRRDFMYLGQWRRGAWHVAGIVRWVQLPKYVAWKEEEILHTLSQEAGWSGTLWEQHADCVMSDAKEYLNLKRFGCLEKADKLSALVRDQQITREKALFELEKQESLLREREGLIREKIADFLGLTRDEMEQATHTLHRSYLPRSGGLYRRLKELFWR